VSAVLDLIARAADALWALRWQLLALTAASYSAFALDQVLVRLDRGGHEPVGRRINWLAAALFIMLLSANNAYHSINVSYGATGVVLMLGGIVWGLRRWNTPPEGPRQGSSLAPLLLLQACALLLGVLWVVQRAFETFTPDRTNPSELPATFGGAGLLAIAMVPGLRTLVPLRGVFHRLALARGIGHWAESPARSTKDPS
jgi:hypothetical protein